MKKHSICLLVFLALTSCITSPPPNEEFTFARAAMDAARSVEAARFSPGYWHQAEDAYRRARLLFENRDYAEAKKLFKQAQIAAEKAENSARLLKAKNGEVF